jgi:hypothetical protein
MRHLCECLHDNAKAFGLDHVERALNLDGGPSAGYSFNTSTGTLLKEPRGAIRDAIVIRDRGE